MTICVSLCVIGQSHAQSDTELLYSKRGHRTYLRQELFFIRTVDLTAIYDERAVAESYFANVLRELSRAQEKEQRREAKKRSKGSQPQRVNNQSVEYADREALTKLELEVSRELRRWSNLKVTTPSNSRRKLKSSRGYRKLSQIAQAFSHSALTAYREVDLERAEASLDSALELMTQARQVIIEPKKVARLYLFRGVISVEQKQYLHASLDFQRALLLNPKIRLKRGFDHELVLQVFGEVIRQLRGLSPLELVRLAERREWVSQRAPALVLIKVKTDLFSLLYRSPLQPQLTRVDLLSLGRVTPADLVSREHYAWADPELANKLASRIWACLPLRRLRASSTLTHPFNIAGGWQLSTPLRTPVSSLAQFGAFVKLAWRVLTQLDFQLGGAWSTSSQDVQRDLTRPLNAWSVYFGPQWTKRWRRAWVSIGVMVESSWLSGSSVTRAVGCKFFDLSYAVPTEICDPQRDIRQIESSWNFGPRFELSSGFRIAEHLLIGAQFFSSFEFYRSTPHPFGWPLGGGVLIGYSFPSR